MAGNSMQGVQVLGNYAAAGTPKQKVERLLALIPNVDSTSSSGAVAGGGFLDEMSPVAANQLRVELTALAANVPNA